MVTSLTDRVQIFEVPAEVKVRALSRMLANLHDGTYADGRGARLVAFFAVLCYAGARPAEGLAPRETDCKLPKVG